MAEKTTIGSVDAPGPEVKLATTRSSIDSVNPSNHPDSSAGVIKGKVTRRNTVRGAALRSAAASSSAVPVSLSLDRTITVT